jgi:hypothetical protein
MKSFAIDILKPANETLILLILEALERKKMLRLRELEPEDNFLSDSSIKKVRKILKKADSDSDLKKSLAIEGEPVSEEELLKAIDEAEKSEVLSGEEARLFFKLLVETE